jgi:hypothetical protein
VTSGDTRRGTRRIPRRPAATVLLSWLAMVGVDVLLNAGVLAPLYHWDSPFLLRPEEAFARIPIGYLSFLVFAALLVWLLPRLAVEGGREGAFLAGAVGAATSGALVLRLWSISTADAALLGAWWAGQTVAFGVGGLVIGSILGDTRVRTVGWRVGVLLVVSLASAVLLQSIGYAAAPVLAR